MPAFSKLLIAFNYLRNDGWGISTDVNPRPQDQFAQLSQGGLGIALPLSTVPAHSKLSKYSSPRFPIILVNPKQERIRPVKSGDGQAHAGENAVNSLRGDKKSDDLQNGSDKLTFSSLTNPEGGSANGAGDNRGDQSRETDVKKEEGILIDSVCNGEVDSPKLDEQKMSEDPASGEKMEHSTGIIETEPANGAPTNSGSGRAPDGEIGMVEYMKRRTPVIRYILRCYIADIIDNFGENHTLAAERLLNLPGFREKSDEIVESVLSQMCATPTPCFPPVYFGTLFVDLCRVKETRLPTKLLTAVNTKFQEAGDMDPESFDRLTEWFSFHLSNFAYKWNWSDWDLYADTEMVDKFPYRAMFCKDVLRRCIRLSYYERIIGIVPQEMSFFFPP